MNTERLDMILAQMAQRRILVVGDFFLDKRLIVEQGLAETLPETGLEAQQVVEVETAPAAAGTVAAHLSSLGVEVVAAGMVGDDGEGFDVLKGLDAAGVDMEGIVIRADRFTPTRIQPALRVRGGALRQQNSIEIRNRGKLPVEAEERIIRSLRGLLPRVHGVIVVDAEAQADFGVITEGVRDELGALAQTYGEVPFVVASSRRARLFQNALIAASAQEVVIATDGDAQWRARKPDWEADRELIESAAERLYRRSGQPVFVTLGARGVLARHADGATLARGGKGGEADEGSEYAAVAAIAAALCAGATVAEAAEVGALAAAVTGAVTRRQILDLSG